MSFITIEATKVTAPPLLVTQITLTTETQPDPSDPTLEQSRAVYRVNTTFDVNDITSFSQPTDSLLAASSLDVAFNEAAALTILPLISDEITYPFKLLTQTFTQKDARGSAFFTADQEWVSVSEWVALTWAK